MSLLTKSSKKLREWVSKSPRPMLSVVGMIGHEIDRKLVELRINMNKQPSYEEKKRLIAFLKDAKMVQIAASF